MKINKTKHEFVNSSRTDLIYLIDYYEYYKGWGSNPFGDAGTAHFIGNEEDPGGFSSEYLHYYDEYKIAELYITFCENDTVNYYGVLRYYRQGEEINVDTIINKCIQKANPMP